MVVEVETVEEVGEVDSWGVSGGEAGRGLRSAMGRYLGMLLEADERSFRAVGRDEEDMVVYCSRQDKETGKKKGRNEKERTGISSTSTSTSSLLPRRNRQTSSNLETQITRLGRCAQQRSLSVSVSVWFRSWDRHVVLKENSSLLHFKTF